MSAQLLALRDRIVVEPSERDTETEGGIVLPETAQSSTRWERGKVIAKGNGRILDNGTRLPVQVDVGDEVFFHRLASLEIEFEGDKYFCMTEGDILAVVGR